MASKKQPTAEITCSSAGKWSQSNQPLQHKSWEETLNNIFNKVVGDLGRGEKQKTGIDTRRLKPVLKIMCWTMILFLSLPACWSSKNMPHHGKSMKTLQELTTLSIGMGIWRMQTFWTFLYRSQLLPLHKNHQGDGFEYLSDSQIHSKTVISLIISLSFTALKSIGVERSWTWFWG